MNQEPPKSTILVPDTPQPEPERQPQYRWSDEFRQEALDYHCAIHGLPPADLDMATGIPDPQQMSPKLAMERGLPYHLYIDWSKKCKREPKPDPRKIIQLETWITGDPSRGQW
jgi:hypothetical protein